jgi:hypothetical protein
MLNIDLCPPAIIYLIFSITQILIDLFKGFYNTVFIKVIVTIMITFLLEILCKKGLNVVSWIIVFIPFILMTVIVSIILYIFGLNATTGTINYNSPYTSTDASGNILVYDPSYNPVTKPVYYTWPNVVIPNPSLNNPNLVPQNNLTAQTNNQQPPQGPAMTSSSPAYQSW